LSSYKVHLPIWDGEKSVFEPFKEWGSQDELSWYQAYNQSKHDRHNEFKKANFENLLYSISGLLVLLSSQFGLESFSPSAQHIGLDGSDYSYYDTQPAIGGFFHIEFPNDWNESELYEFNWSDIKNETDRFNKINYNI
jgi:hypothetical protein